MIVWKYNDNIVMKLDKPTIEEFDRFMKKSYLFLFLDNDLILKIKNKFKQEYNL